MATISCRCGSPLNDFNVFLMDALDAPDDIAASAAALAFKIVFAWDLHVRLFYGRFSL